MRTGQSVEQISKDIDRDKYLTAQGAKEYGLIDDILTSYTLVMDSIHFGCRRHPCRVTTTNPAVTLEGHQTISKDIDRDKYLTAQGAKEYGLIDDILTSL
jgi:ATP-dependent protease ClpP protease subunit